MNDNNVENFPAEIAGRPYFKFDASLPLRPVKNIMYEGKTAYTALEEEEQDTLQNLITA